MRVASSMLVLAAAMALPVGARAADADTMSVTGAITANNACSMSLQDGGNINFGIIPASALHPTNRTDMNPRALGVTINCSTPTYIVLQLHEMADGTEGEHRLGLGLVRPDTPIGWYEIRHSPTVTVNGTAGHIVKSPTPSPGASWDTAYSYDPWRLSDLRSFAYVPSGAAVAQPITTAQFTFDIRASIYSLAYLGITGATPINGQFLLELMYM